MENGELIMGIADKTLVGTSSGGLIHVTWLEAGWEGTRRVLGSIQVLVNRWLLAVTSSIGVSDTIADAGSFAFLSFLKLKNYSVAYFS